MFVIVFIKINGIETDKNTLTQDLYLKGAFQLYIGPCAKISCKNKM